MAVRTRDLLKILLREIQNKKALTARYDTICSLCDGHIEEMEDFYFFGFTEKVCPECYEELIEMIETLIEKS